MNDPWRYSYLSHFIGSSLPGEPLVIEGIIVGADVDRLPVRIGRSPLRDVENIQFVWKEDQAELYNLLQGIMVFRYENDKKTFSDWLQQNNVVTSDRLKTLAYCLLSNVRICT